MFKVNDYVDHKHCGVCLIKDIAVMSGDASGTQYYVLEPLFGEDKGTILRVPVSNSASLTAILSKQQALKLVQSWPALGDFYEMDSKKRKLAYESAISGGDLSALAPLLEGIKQRKLTRGPSQFDGPAIPEPGRADSLRRTLDRLRDPLRRRR
jgi:RNA polymerase-interacting CarD/CdnL/TRCF family regulator